MSAIIINEAHTDLALWGFYPSSHLSLENINMSIQQLHIEHLFTKCRAQCHILGLQNLVKIYLVLTFKDLSLLGKTSMLQKHTLTM